MDVGGGVVLRYAYVNAASLLIQKEDITTLEETKARPSFPEVYMRLAEIIATRSTCSRLQVGTVITTTDFRKVISIGYNGNASGLDNKCDRDTPGACGCLHSEENAAINCDVPRETKKYVFVTHLPCPLCAKRLINLGGVQKVFYKEDYRIKDSVDILTSAGIEVEMFHLQGI